MQVYIFGVAWFWFVLPASLLSMFVLLWVKYISIHRSEICCRSYQSCGLSELANIVCMCVCARAYEES